MEDGVIEEDAISKSIFVTFWRRMSNLLEYLPSAPMPPQLPEEFHWIRAMTRLIAIFGSSVATNVACVEVEDFFDLVKQAQLKAQSVGDQNDVNLFGVWLIHSNRSSHPLMRAWLLLGNA
jgi:hypothetical protein